VQLAVQSSAAEWNLDNSSVLRMLRLNQRRVHWSNCFFPWAESEQELFGERTLKTIPGTHFQ